MAMATNHYATAGIGGLPAPHAEAHRAREAGTADVALLAKAMAAAFYADPVATWLLQEDSRRMRQLERGFALLIRGLYLPAGDCYTTEHVAGGALWVPPGGGQAPLVTQLRVLAGVARICGRGFPRFLRYSRLLEAKHPRERHYYLPYMGVAPGCQGRGIGSALLRPVLERCDSAGVPAYLEASSTRNRDLYERHGFEVVEIVELAMDGPAHWLMWREPRR
jgi:GNAT superfamily N-acetyltransferase